MGMMVLGRLWYVNEFKSYAAAADCERAQWTFSDILRIKLANDMRYNFDATIWDVYTAHSSRPFCYLNIQCSPKLLERPKLPKSDRNHKQIIWKLFWLNFNFHEKLSKWSWEIWCPVATRKKSRAGKINEMETKLRTRIRRALFCPRKYVLMEDDTKKRMQTEIKFWEQMFVGKKMSSALRIDNSLISFSCLSRTREMYGFRSIGEQTNIYWIFSMTRDIVIAARPEYVLEHYYWPSFVAAFTANTHIRITRRHAYGSLCWKRLTKCCHGKGKHTKGRNNVYLRRFMLPVPIPRTCAAPTNTEHS